MKLSWRTRHAIEDALRAVPERTLEDIALEFKVGRTTVGRVCQVAGLREHRVLTHYIYTCPRCNSEQMAEIDTVPGCPRCAEELAVRQ